MPFHFLKRFRQAWSRSSTPQGSAKPSHFRPRLEALEERVVPTTRTWTGGSILSNHWSDQFNWQNGVPQQGDSVFFPADAHQRTNVQDIVISQGPSQFPLQVGNLRIAGGDYNLHSAYRSEGFRANYSATPRASSKAIG